MPLKYPGGIWGGARGVEEPRFESEEELKSVLHKLETGNKMMNFSMKMKPQESTFLVMLVTRQVLWGKGLKIKGSFDIHEIKEIRRGKISRDFERMHDGARRTDSQVCFSIFYGNEFNLNVLSVAAKEPIDCDVWIRGLSYLVHDTLKAPYPLKVRRILQKEFKQIARKNLVTLEAAKAWLSNMNARPCPNSELKEIFEKVESSQHKGELGFEQFVEFYNGFMHHGQKSFMSFIERYSSDKLRFHAHDIQRFLQEEQKESWASNLNAVKHFMTEYICDAKRQGDGIYLDSIEMLAFLFSKENSLWNEEYLKEPSDEMLDHPLSHYWISTSHNTFLTGNQIKCSASCEAYARALRMGCRFVELECWDGPDGMPRVYCGCSVTAKIKFLDVLKTIREHAFVTSDLPVILSIENQCRITQQRCMATMLIDVFQDMLVRKPISSDDSCLPTPNQLRGKILIKCKKFTASNRSTEVFSSTSVDSASDIFNSINIGTMYFEDPILKEWNLHDCILTHDRRLIYTEQRQTAPPSDGNGDSVSDPTVSKNIKPVDKLQHKMQKGEIDLTSCRIELEQYSSGDRKRCFRIRKAHGETLQVAVETKEELIDWLTHISAAIRGHDNQARRVTERQKTIAIELSDLAVYCQSISWREDYEKSHPYEMVSLHESKAERLTYRDKFKHFLACNRRGFSRIYPKGSRFDSSNYHPMPFWNSGSQLVALNFQTGDRAMQLNEARFEMYNRCGYVLQPQCLLDEDYHMYDKTTLPDVDPLTMNIQIIGARHIPKSDAAISRLFIEVEVQGCDYDQAKFKTPARGDNGLNPIWYDNAPLHTDDCSFAFDIRCPATAFIRFTVMDQDTSVDPRILAFAAIPVDCVKPGLRCVPLKNAYSEEIPLASLLVRLDIRNVG